MRRVLPFALLVVVAAACQVNEGRRYDIEDVDVLLTILHTSDMHSRLVPYDLKVGEVDRRLGLLQDSGPFGGAARLGYLVKRERGRAGRSLYLDTGDPFQGAPIFNFFEGEAEIRVLSEIGLDAMVVGNHEFDRGGANLSRQLDRWARFPALASNYRFVPQAFSTNALARIVQPFALFNVEGLRVAVIGVGDTSSMHSIFEPGNSLGITPLHTETVVQQYVDFVRPFSDVVVVATHLGLSGDERMIAGTTGIDVVLGGHLHIVLDPPKVLEDCQPGAEVRETHACSPRPVILAHSGAFMKYLGRLDLIFRRDADDPLNGFEVVSHAYTLYPVDAGVPDDPAVAYLLEPYVREMERVIDLDRLVGYAPSTVARFGSVGGDSELGNLVSDAMWLRSGIETDFALTNTTGIRANIDAGPVTTETLFNVFPFDNTITTMFLSGAEVQELFDYVARRTASRGCSSQAQIAGARVTLNCRGTPCEPCRYLCGGTTPCRVPCDGVFCSDACSAGLCTNPCDGEPCAEAIVLGSGIDARPLEPLGSYELATNNYLAGGGSGYVMLRRNTTQRDSGIPQRDAVLDRIRRGEPCREAPACASDGECREDEVCACPGRWWLDADTGVCGDRATCGTPEPGRCVIAACLDGVALLYARNAAAGTDADPLALACRFRDTAGDQCATVACVDEGSGAAEDGRIRAYLP